jgi:hypothetical protein
MSDKANQNIRAEEIAESIKNGSASAGDAIQNFVQDLLPRANGSASEGASSIKDSLSNKQREQFEGRDSITNKLEKVQIVGPDEKGVIDLKTGDTLVRAGGHEVLMMKGGGSVVINPDGSYEMKSEKGAKVKHDAKTGSTTLDFGEGSTVVIRDGRVAEVNRDGRTAVMSDFKLRPRDWNELEKPLHRNQQEQSIPNIIKDKAGK